jgi:glycosyltransferase involved in cell wall biosynthesis
MAPAVSVGIPTYRQPALAFRAVSSTLEQEGCDFEVFVCDDSGDDSVHDALRPFFSDPRFRYLRNDRRLGAVANWNKALDEGRAPVRKILHHDDWFAHRHALARFVEPITAGQSVVVFAACNARNEAGTVRFIHRASSDDITELSRRPASILFRNFLGAPSVMAMHHSLRSRFDPEYLWVSDIEFYRRLVVEAKGQIAYVDEPLVDISTDLASQITRQFEAEGGFSLCEYILMFQSAGLSAEERVQARAFLDGFEAGLKPPDRQRALACAIRRRKLRLTAWIALRMFRRRVIGRS